MNLRLVFYAEVFINVITVALCFFAPRIFIEQLVSDEPGLFALELARWYGLLLLLLSGIMLAALWQRSFDILRIVLIVNLPGDILQIALAAHTAQAFHQWSMGLIFTVVFCALLFIMRVAVLWKPRLAGY